MNSESSYRTFLKKHQLGVTLGIILILAGCFLLTNLDRFPLVDYDEGTYARVIHDTMTSGDISTLKYFGQPWFEKPPLYFWSAILAVSALGENEIAMRLPAAIFSLLTLLFTALIVARLSNLKNAIFAAFILLFSAMYFYYSREIRVDTGVLMSMMAALCFLIKGWERKKSLLGFWPAIAIGFLFKDVIALLIIPVTLIFSLIYRKWCWLKSKYFWLGTIPALVIAAPWHIVQHLKYGTAFWNDYLGYHVFDRAVKGLGIGIEKATNNHWGYVQYLWDFAQPIWVIFLVAASGYIILLIFKRKYYNPLIISCLITIVFFLVIFTLAKTQIITYLLPIFPFVAIAVAIIGAEFTSRWRWLHFSVMFLLIGTLIYTNHYYQFALLPYHYEQKEVSLKYRDKVGTTGIPLYVIEWPIHESIRYYSQTKPTFVTFQKDRDVQIPGPAYMIINKEYLNYFFDSTGQALPEYRYLQVSYFKQLLALIYTDNSIVLKSSGYKERQ
ncbi:MAG: glycosyltransferase family 39 protein [Candidatus Komeilibacteria bacterium]